MPTASLMDYLAGDALTKLAQAYANRPGLARPFPASFYATKQNPNAGTTTVSYDVETSSREAAKVRNPDSPSAMVQGVGVQNKKVVGLGSREAYPIGLEMIGALQSNSEIVRMNAQAELQRQVRNFVDRFRNLRTNAAHSVLFRGKIDVAADGEIQTTSFSPMRTIDYGVPTGNLITHDGSGSTYNIGDWSNSATNIVLNVQNLKKYQSRQRGFDVTNVYYDVNVPGYLAANTSFKEYLTRNPNFNQQFVNTGEIPNGVLDLNWTPIYKAVHVTGGTGGTSATITGWTSGKFISFSPDPGADWWYENLECGLPAPTGLTSEAQITEAMLNPDTLSKAFPIRWGMHSYSLMNADPIMAKLIVADFHLPALKSANAYMFGTCAG